MEPLSGQLATPKNGAAARMAPERLAVLESSTTALRATGIESSALKPGGQAPDLALDDTLGSSVRLSDLWRRGPLVIVFYRGGWCPYCNLTLRAWQQRLPEMANRGASLVAISPQSPDNTLDTAEKNALAFPVLSDSALAAASAFGIAFDLPPDLVEIYKGFGNDLPVRNGNGRWTLPVPATFVIGHDGRIAFAHVDADYRQRAEPDDVLRVVDRLRGMG